MHNYTAQISWYRGNQTFIDQRYSRRHQINFDGGQQISASSSPHIVRVPLSDPTGADPEELFVASLSSCHMLWFLSLAAECGFCVDSYVDNVSGVMSPADDGKLVMSVVILRPDANFSGDKLPTAKEILHLHHRAHEECFIANSVRTDVRCEPVLNDIQSVLSQKHSTDQ